MAWIARSAAFLFVAISVVAGSPCFAQTEPVDQASPLAHEELAALRGGYYTVDGYTFDFGATIRTTVDGVPVLESSLMITPDGARVVTGDAGTPYGGWQGSNGVTLKSDTGDTTVIHKLVDGQIQGVILNDASGRSIQQDIGVALRLPGFEAVQNNIEAARVAGRLNADMALGLINSARN